MSRVGERIKEARQKSGMTQKALAKKLGVAENQYLNLVTDYGNMVSVSVPFG